MKILLIYPNWNDPLYSALPLGLAMIAGVLRKNGFAVRALDCSALNLNISQVQERIISMQPDVIGISVMTPTIKEALSIAKACKVLKKTRVVLGGPHPTISPNEVMADKNVDFVIKGEGEITFLELCQELKKRKPIFSKVKGIVYKEKGIVKHTPERDLMENLDDLPFPAIDMFPLNKYKQSIGETNKFITMITSRGCPYICTYCINSCEALFGKKYRALSAQRVVDEIIYYVRKYGIEEIHFYDDNFTFDKARVEKICELIGKHRLKIKWRCSSRVESIDLLLLRKMKKAGCYLIAYGVESGTKEILDSVHRFTDLKRIKQTFDLTHKSGIKTLAYFMFGYPEESKETIRRSVNFAIDLDATYVQFALITPYPRTKIYEEYVQNNLLLTDDWSKFIYVGAGLRPVIRTKYLTEKQLLDEYKKAIRRFYLRPRYVFKQIKNSLSLQGIRRSIDGLKQVINWSR